ncbi:hypothetical protein FXO38_15080 [Capsicum annuum]|nr:hypothetical protein FXO38_15080 [Capsicum annuum]KAF3683592.1 hypothetical protein FXO37_01752 [Capsicum annuum]
MGPTRNPPPSGDMRIEMDEKENLKIERKPRFKMKKLAETCVDDPVFLMLFADYFGAMSCFAGCFEWFLLKWPIERGHLWTVLCSLDTVWYHSLTTTGLSSSSSLFFFHSNGSGGVVGANDAPLTVFETTNHYYYDHTGCTDFAPSSECSACKCQDCKVKHDGVINTINALTASVEELISKRGVILSKRISYPYTLLEIKVAKRRRKEIFKALSSIEKAKL